MYYVYVIQSQSTRKRYTGMTIDLDRRISEHNRKLSNTKSTKYIFDFEYIFCTSVGDRSTARLLEKYLKSGIGREFINSLT